jgi:hypothetical protein
MSQDGSRIVSKLGELVDVNRRMLAILERQNQQGGGGQNQQGGGGQNTPNIGGLNSGTDGLMGMATAMKSFVEAAVSANLIKPSAADNLVSFYEEIIEGIIKPIQEYNEEKIATFTNFIDVISKSTGKLMNDMAKAAFIGPFAIMGTIMFSMVVEKIVEKITTLPDMKKETLEGLKLLFEMSKNIGKFILVMALTSLVAPMAAMGTLAFSAILVVLGGSLKLVFLLLGDSSTKEGFEKGPLGALIRMGTQIAIFTLIMVAISMLVPQVLKGTIIFGTMLIALAGALFIVQKIVKADLSPDGKDNSPLGSLMQMAVGIAIFTLVIIALPLVKSQLVAGYMTFVALMAGVSFALMIAYALAGGGKSKDSPLNSMYSLAIGIAIFSLVIIALGIPMISEAFQRGAWTLMWSLIWIGIGLRFIAADTVKKGASNMMVIGVSILIFIAALAVYKVSGAADLTLMQLLKLGLVVAVMGTAAAILGSFGSMVTTGAVSMVIIGASLFVFVAALTFYANSKAKDLTLEELGTLGLAITGMSVIATAVGAVAGLIIPGAIALMLIGSALGKFVNGLSVFAASNFTSEMATTLALTIAKIGVAVAGIGFGALLIGTGAALLYPMSNSILKLANAFKIFNEINYSEELGNMAVDAVGKVVEAFTKPFADLTLTKFAKLMAGIYLVGKLSKVLGELAKGVGEMANQNVLEFAVANGQIVPVGIRKLTDKDFENAGNFVTKLIGDTEDGSGNPMITALYKFGEKIVGGTTWYGANYISSGIDMLAKLSRTLGTIGQGVADLASSNIVEYGIANPGTADAKIIPIGIKTLTEQHFTQAGTFVNNLIGNVGVDAAGKGTANPLVMSIMEFGKMVKEGEGWFSSGYLGSGIDMLAQLSGILGNLGEGILKFAEGEFVPMTVINPGTKEAKLVPSNPVKIADTHFIKAAAFINQIIGNITDDSGKEIANPLVTSLMDFGKKVKEGAGWWGKGHIQAGIEMLSKLTQAIGGLGDNIIKMAKGQFVINEVVDGKVIPVKMVSLDESVLATASTNINRIIDFLPEAMQNVGKIFAGGGMPIEAVKTLAKASDLFGEILANILKNFGDPKKIEEANKTYQSFVSSFTTADYKKFEKGLSATLLKNYDSFEKTTERLSKIATPFEKFVKSFGDMAKHMGVFATNFKVMTPEGISSFQEWTDSMIQISKVDITKSEGIVNFVNDTVSAAFGGGKSDKVSADKSPQKYSEADKTNQLSSMQQKPASAETGGKAQAPAPIDTSAIVNAIQQGFSNITVDNMTVINFDK